jgi:hypothetical protein
MSKYGLPDISKFSEGQQKLSNDLWEENQTLAAWRNLLGEVRDLDWRQDVDVIRETLRLALVPEADIETLISECFSGAIQKLDKRIKKNEQVSSVLYKTEDFFCHSSWKGYRDRARVLFGV